MFVYVEFVRYCCQLIIFTLMDNVPNMSSIIKDLKSIDNRVDIFSKTGQFSKLELNTRSDFISSKQQGLEKHKQMMQRLKDSKNAIKNLMDGLDLLDQQSRPEANMPIENREKKDNLAAFRNIRYRHLEHQQGKQKQVQKNIQINNKETSNYGSFLDRRKQTKEVSTQYEQIIQNVIESPGLDDYKSTGSSRDRWKQPKQRRIINSNEDILQRYYDICSRRNKQRPHQLSQTSSKFTRPIRQEVDVPKRSQKISEAMNILIKK